MRLWEIIKLIDEKKLIKGDQFKAINIPFDLVLEFDEDDSLVYARIMGNTTERKTVSCSGEMRIEFIQLLKRCLREFDMIKELTINTSLKAKRSDGYWDGYIYFNKEGHLVWEDGKHYIVTGSTALWDVFY